MTDRLDSSHDFHDRFRACTHKLSIGEKNIEYTLMEHKAPGDPRTVCFIPGLGISYSAYEKSLETLYSTSRSFFACGYIEAGLPLPPLAKEWIDKGFAKGEHVQRALGLIAALESLPHINRPVDVVAHSVGAIPAVLAAELRPDLFQTLALYAPAACIKNDSPLRILRESGNIGTVTRNQLMQLNNNSKGEHARSFLSKMALSYARYFHEHAFSLHAEVRDVAAMNIAPLVRDLIPYTKRRQGFRRSRRDRCTFPAVPLSTCPGERGDSIHDPHGRGSSFYRDGRTHYAKYCAGIFECELVGSTRP